MNVQLLFFEGCPNHRPAVELVQSVMQELGLGEAVEEVEIHDNDEAAEYRFLGSPTIQIDGVDVDPAARSRDDFAFSCRMYGTSGLPTRDVVRAAFLESTSAGDCCPAVVAQSNVESPGNKSTLLTAGGSVVAAVIASACCWLPPLLLLFGVSAVGVSTAFAVMRPWFLGAAFILLGLGFYLTYRRKPECASGSSCAPPSRKLVRFNRTMLWVALVGVLAFAFFPKYFGLAAGDGTASLPPDAAKVTLQIDGMTCETCATGLQQTLREVPGVLDASVSYEEKTADVAVDGNSPPTTSSLIDAVKQSGFRAKEVQ